MPDTTATSQATDVQSNPFTAMMFHATAISQSPLANTFIGKAAMSLLAIKSTVDIGRTSFDAVGGMVGFTSEDLINKGKEIIAKPETQEKIAELKKQVTEKSGDALEEAVKFFKGLIEENKETLSKIPGIKDIIEPALKQMESITGFSKSLGNLANAVSGADQQSRTTPKLEVSNVEGSTPPTAPPVTSQTKNPSAPEPASRGK